MNLTDMTNLIEAHDALEDLKKVLGVQNMALAFTSGVLGKLSRITDVIFSNSKVEEKRIWDILQRRILGPEGRAAVLLGIKEEPERDIIPDE